MNGDGVNGIGAHEHRHGDLRQVIVEFGPHFHLEQVGAPLLDLRLDGIHRALVRPDLVRRELTSLFHVNPDVDGTALVLLFADQSQLSVQLGLSAVHAKVGRRVDEEPADVIGRPLQLAAGDPALGEALGRVIAVGVLLRAESDHVEVVLGADHGRRLCDALGSVLFTARCPPVRHDDAAETELPAQDCGQKVVLRGRPGAVHGAVGRHDRRGRPFADRDLEAPQVDLPECSLRDDALHLHAAVFLIVAAEMLDGAHLHALAHAAQLHDRHFAGEQGVLREILEVSAVQGMSVNVHPGAQQRIDVVLAQLKAQPVIELLDHHVIPGAGQAGARRYGKGLGAAVHADAAGAVRAASQRDAKSQKPVGHTAESGSRSGRDFGGAHALASCQADQVLIAELREEGLHRYFAVAHVAQAVPAVPRIRDLFGHSLRPPLKGSDRP